jgi:hypothetical protein
MPHFRVIGIRFSVGEASTLGLNVGLAHYGNVLVHWYVVHSHERCLTGSVFDDGFKVCFNITH